MFLQSCWDYMDVASHMIGRRSLTAESLTPQLLESSHALLCNVPQASWDKCFMAKTKSTWIPGYPWDPTHDEHGLTFTVGNRDAAMGGYALYHWTTRRLAHWCKGTERWWECIYITGRPWFWICVVALSYSLECGCHPKRLHYREGLYIRLWSCWGVVTVLGEGNWVFRNTEEFLRIQTPSTPSWAWLNHLTIHSLWTPNQHDPGNHSPRWTSSFEDVHSSRYAVAKWPLSKWVGYVRAWQLLTEREVNDSPFFSHHVILSRDLFARIYPLLSCRQSTAVLSRNQLDAMLPELPVKQGFILY